MGIKDLVRRERDTEYFFFSGKGGVGKTSVAAATALWLSRNSGKKVLIISTDPAHSLSDSFDMKIGGDIVELRKNLYGVEIDPEKAVQEYKERLMPQINNIDCLKGLGLEDTFDIAGSTPGIDEIAAFDKFLQYMHSKDFDVIIFDTAPTGHALRFLSLPDVLDSWIGKMIKMRMKLSGIANMFKKILPFGDPENEKPIGTEQLDVMKKRIEDAKRILTDPKKTSYNLVTIPELMCIYETERCLKTIEGYRIPVKSVIVNQLIPNNSHCAFCSEKRKIQDERLRTIGEKFRRFRIMQVPLYKEEVRGFGMLERVGKEIYGNA